MFKRFTTSYREVFTPARVKSLGVGLLLLALGLIFQGYASTYSMHHSQQFVGDFFLDNLPSVYLNPIIVEGALLALVLSTALLVWHPRYIIFTLKAAALFVAVRAFFVAVTHLGIYPNQVIPDAGSLDRLYVSLGLEAGYFFSAHTGLPFLVALIFWNKRWVRLAYLGLTLIFGISVLLAKVHYSIDVFAAPFMTYSIFKIAQYFFAEDYKLIELER